MEAEAAKFFEQKSGSGSGGGAKDLEAEAEAFLVKDLQMEAEAIFFSILEEKAEANFFSKKFWKQKQKQIFFQKNFGSGSGSVFKINRFQNTV